MSLRPFALPVALLLSACANMGQEGRGYPSLAKRPIETRNEDQEVSEAAAGSAVAPPGADSALDEQLAKLTEQARRGETAFDTLYEEVAGRIRVATSAAPSSESWVAAQVDIGRLEQTRYDSVYALASLDMLYIERMKDAADGKAAAGIASLEMARGAALGIVDSQNDRLDRLQAVLKQP